MNYIMSAIGPKWIPLVALYMFAFGGKADITSALGRQYCSLVRWLRTVIALSDNDVSHGTVLTNFNSPGVLG